MTEDTTSTTSNNSTTTTTATAQQDAVRKAQEIVARLSNQYPIVVAPVAAEIGSHHHNHNNTTITTTTTEENTTATTSTKGSKRKRWGVMSSSSSFHEDHSSSTTGTDTMDASKRLHTTDGTVGSSMNNNNTASSSNNNNSNSHHPVTANAQIPIAQLLMGTVTAPPPSSTTTTTNNTDVIVKRLWVTVNNERPAAHYVAYMKPKLKRIVAQANGITLPTDDGEDDDDEEREKDATQEDTTTDNEQNEDDDSNDTTKLRIVFKGKGSTNIPPLPGVPEEPLHVYLTGPKSLMDTNTPLVDALINEASRAEPLIAAVIAAQQAQERALITTMESIQTNTYKPMSVTSLIHGNNSNTNNDNKDSNQLLALPADRLAAALLHGTTAALTQEMEVPNHVVGTIIGRGGETIAAIQAQTNCKLQIQKEQDMVPGQINRIITMSANTQSSMDACQSIIQSLVQERMQKMNAAGSHYGGGGGGNPSQYSSSSSSNPSQIVLLDGSTVPSHHSLVEVQVPDADVGLVIGKGGVTIKQIQEQSGANVHVPKSANIENPTVRTLQVTCPNLEGANLAKQLIEDVLKTKPGFGASGGMNPYQSQQQVSLQVSVPDKDVGLCIGRGGCVIKYMQSTTQTRIQIPPTVPNPGDIYRVITVTGPNMEACQQVQSMIHRILSEQSSAGVMSGNHAAQPQQPYGNPYTAATSAQSPQINQPGYTAEWAAYHAAQQQQQQQVQYQETTAAAAVTAATQQAATTAAVPATNEYTEPFFRYAYYYGEEAARQYYGAWSPPVGTPNPYGVNPNGITTPAAAAVATTATTTATTPVETANSNYGTITEQVQSTATNAASAPMTTTTTDDDDAAAAFARETSRRHVSNLPAWMTKK